MYKSIEFVPKIEPDSLEVLSLIYTPGVGEACMKIKENDGLSYIYTNRENSVAVISFDYQKSLKRAIFLKSTLNIDAYPFEVSVPSENIQNKTINDCRLVNPPYTDNFQVSQLPSPLAGEGEILGEHSASRRNSGEGLKVLKLVVENIEPNFCGIDLTLISNDVKDIEFEVEIPVMKESGADIKEFFKPFSKNIFQFDLKKLQEEIPDFKEQALYLRKKAGGVIETHLSEDPQTPPVAIVSEGSAVLGFGNIGAHAAIPVMEGKAVIFKAIGGVNAISLCLKTQVSEEIVKIVTALKNSFSGINLEDISAPRCFDIERKLVETLDIPVFHDDQHGTAIVVLAALLNALSLAKKKISDVNIVISGAGAAAQAVSKLLMSAGATNIIHTNSKGIVHKSPSNEASLQALAEMTNKKNLQGSLEDALGWSGEGADVFIGLSTAGVLKPEGVNVMKKDPIIFALANPVPEIMPEDAKKAGAYIVATGRSDFDNQINNSLAFPGLFRGLLTHKIQKITDEIKLECAIAIASLVKDEELKETNILPNSLDPRVVKIIVERLTKFGD